MSTFFEILQQQADQLPDVDAQRQFFQLQAESLPSQYPDGYDLAVDLEEMVGNRTPGLFFPIILSGLDGSLQGFTERLGALNPDELGQSGFLLKHGLSVCVEPVQAWSELNDLDRLTLQLQRRSPRLPGVRVTLLQQLAV